MTKHGFVALALLVGCVNVVTAQQCSPPAHPYFEFQVTKPAAYQSDSTVLPKPLARPRVAGDLLVQFVVDSTGKPEDRTLRVLFSPSDSAAAEARAVLQKWRFTPAEVRGCKVPQVVQTVVGVKE